MLRLLELSLAVTAGLAIAVIAAPEHERPHVTFSAVSANDLPSRAPTRGASMLHGGDTACLTVAHSDLCHIVAGSYLGVAAKSMGGMLMALDVLAFPPSMTGAAEGNFGWVETGAAGRAH
jgi:hypothetical protein